MGYSTESVSTAESGLFKIMTIVAGIISDSEKPSLESIAEQLVEQHLLVDPKNGSATNNYHLVFTLIGWLTMLYSPSEDLHSGQATVILPRDTSGEKTSTEVFTSFSKPLDELDGLALHQMIKQFGQLIPGNFLSSQSISIVDVFSEQLVMSCLNFMAVSKVAGIRVVFTECLSLHLDFDEKAQVLKLFRFPSFCKAVCSELQGNSGDDRVQHQYLFR